MTSEYFHNLIRPLRTCHGAVIALYCVAAILMNAVLPLGEAPDEPAHYQYIEHVARHWHLPMSVATPDANVSAESFQPPGYYFAASLLAAPWAQDEETLYYNPQFSFGAREPGYLHGPENHFPWQGPALGWHLARLFSTALGAITLILAWHIALRIFADRHLATAAVAIVAFNPQFIYLHSVITNDAAAVTAATWLIWLSLKLLDHPRPITFAFVGIAISAAALAKANAITILPGAFIAAVLALRQMRGKPTEQAMSILALVAIPLAVAGWWFARNVLLYGDLVGLNAARVFLADNFWPEPLGPLEMLHHLPRLTWTTFKTSWGFFGWMAFHLPKPLYVLLLAIHAIALLGLFTQLARTKKISSESVVLTVMAISAVAAYLYFNRTVNYSGWHGRLLMPVITISAVAIVAGFHAFTKDTRKLGAAIIGCMILLLVYTLAFVFGPAYVW